MQLVPLRPSRTDNDIYKLMDSPIQAGVRWQTGIGYSDDITIFSLRPGYTCVLAHTVLTISALCFKAVETPFMLSLP